MKKRYLCYIAVLGLSSCVKEEVPVPTFEVTTVSQTYRVGEQVTFDFTGRADFLTFWSGESGADYEHRERIVMTGGVVTMSFSSAVQFGAQERNLQVYLSNDFSGEYTPEGVENATWIDLTDRFTYGTGTSFIPSGVVEISDATLPETPFHIGFKYDGKPPEEVGGATQRTWQVHHLDVTVTFPGNRQTQLLTQQTAGYLFVDILNPANFWEYDGNIIIFRPRSSAVASSDWAITAPIVADRTEPDVGFAIKGFSDNMLESYRHTYETPGNYKVVFVASNATVHGQQTLLREINLNILP